MLDRQGGRYAEGSWGLGEGDVEMGLGQWKPVFQEPFSKMHEDDNATVGCRLGAEWEEMQACSTNKYARDELKTIEVDLGVPEPIDMISEGDANIAAVLV